METVETDVPALTGSGSRESGIDSTITSVLVGPLHRNIFGVCKGLVGLLVFSCIEHQCADLVVRRRPVAHGCVKQTRGQLLAAAQKVPALEVEGLHLVHFFLEVEYLHS